MYFFDVPYRVSEEMDIYRSYRSRDICLAYLNALNADDPDAEIGL